MMSLAALPALRGATFTLSRYARPFIGRRLASTAYSSSQSRSASRPNEALDHQIHERYLEWAFDTAAVKMPASRLEALQHDKDIRAALEGVSGSPKSSVRPEPVVHLWNSLSLKLAADRKDNRAVVCMSTGHRRALGAYLGDVLQLDYTFFTVSGNVLQDVVNGADIQVSMRPLSCVLGSGEHKRQPEEDSYRQLKAVKRYRVDLPMVHGFQLSNDHITLASLNASGIWISPRLPVSDIRPWVAHLALLYHAEVTRIRELRYRVEQTEFPRWDASFGETHRPRALVPFWASRPPGRSTFAAFVLGQTPCDEATMKDGDALGFFKLSWQDVQASSREGELLQRLHSPRYINGVVRPTFVRRDAYRNAVSVPVVGGTSTSHSRVRRVKEIIELGSIGKPLSQARSPRHLLYVFYDLIETLRSLFKKNIVHRDVSWYNILLDPIHTVDDGRGVEPHRCISQLMFDAGLDVTERPFGRMRGASDTVFESCVLLADFDHAMDASTSSETVRREQIGTPMFIAVERSNPQQCQFNKPLDGAGLLADLGEVETSDNGLKLFNAAFPAGDGEFMNSFKGMIGEECERRLQDKRKRERRINYDGQHEPRHDVESAWWTFLWAFSRALPRGAAPEGNVVFNVFCRAMLLHTIEPDVEDWLRAKHLFEDYEMDMFHPRLIVFERLFRALRTYLAIPWHLYPGIPHDHAFTACQRLILAALASDDAALDIELDTEKPRKTTALNGLTTLRGMAARTRSQTANVRPAFVAASLRQDDFAFNGAVSAENVEEPAHDERFVIDSHVQPVPDVEPVLAMDEDIHREVDDTDPVAGRQRRKKQPSDYDVYRHDVHVDLWTPHALRGIIWKDKELWFK